MIAHLNWKSGTGVVVVQKKERPGWGAHESGGVAGFINQSLLTQAGWLLRCSACSLMDLPVRIKGGSLHAVGLVGMDSCADCGAARELAADLDHGGLAAAISPRGSIHA